MYADKTYISMHLLFISWILKFSHEKYDFGAASSQCDSQTEYDISCSRDTNISKRNVYVTVLNPL